MCISQTCDNHHHHHHVHHTEKHQAVSIYLIFQNIYYILGYLRLFLSPCKSTIFFIRLKESGFSWFHIKYLSVSSLSLLYYIIFLNKNSFRPCCRIWIRTQGHCYPSSMACTASRAPGLPSVWWWWTTCCREPWRCTTSTTWKAHRINAVPRVKNVQSPRPPSKTWTSMRCMRAYTLTQTPTAPWWRLCRGTVGCVHWNILHLLTQRAKHSGLYEVSPTCRPLASPSRTPWRGHVI